MELLFAFYNHGRLEIYVLGNSNSLVISNDIWWDSSGGVWFIMSYDIFVDSSILNFGGRHYAELSKILNRVENPKWHVDSDSLDIHIDEDFDRRHITAILEWLEVRE